MGGTYWSVSLLVRGPPAIGRYAKNRPSAVDFDHRRSIEGDRRSEKKGRRRRREETKLLSSPPAGSPRIVACALSPAGDFSPARRERLSRAPSSPTGCPRAIFLPHEERGTSPRVGRKIEVTQSLVGSRGVEEREGDIALAAVSMRPIPLAPIMEKLSLTPENYGTARRFFIQTLDDHMLSPDVQEKLVRENPPHGIYKIKGSDHCPFFSRPQALNKILLEIAQLP
ncbi:hypothetical protein GW17_00007916 [Ensete ventricosum]|nr:hypothetical protein GW17_00007916 [Ensete ventricosum]